MKNNLGTAQALAFGLVPAPGPADTTVPAKAAVVAREADEDGIPKRTLERAKKELGVRSRKEGAGPWYWQLPEGRQGPDPRDLATFGEPGDLRPAEVENGDGSVPAGTGGEEHCQARSAARLAALGAGSPAEAEVRGLEGTNRAGLPCR